MKDQDRRYSLEELIVFCDDLGRSGKLKSGTARARKTACISLFSGLSPVEQADVRKIDVAAALDRYANGNDVSKRTLQEYGSRARAAIAAFFAAVDKQPHDEPVEVKKTAIRDSSSMGTDKEDREQEKSRRSSAPHQPGNTASMTLPIPMRSDFVAQLVLPYDLTPAEAERLSKIIEALPMGKE
jgi:hypothetical protein